MSNNQQKFCVYITVYKGNKLPPFYIGSSSIKRIEEGYRGSVSSKRYKHIWKRETSSNPELFKTKIIYLTDTRSKAAKFELKIQQTLQVHNNPLYINMGYFYGGHIVYSLDNEARKLIAAKKVGHKHSEETKRKISISNLGKKHSEETKNMWKDGRRKGPNSNKYGKVPSQEHRDKISKAQKGIPCPQRGRKGRKSPNEGMSLSKQTKINMSKYYWIITDDSGLNIRVDVLSEWCKNHNFRYDSVRPCLIKTGRYKQFYGKRFCKNT